MDRKIDVTVTAMQLVQNRQQRYDISQMDSAFRSVVAKQARSFQRFPKGKPFKNTCCVYFLKISKTLV